jgi:hypothetical protein
LNSISDVFVSLSDHTVIAWWLEEAMPITSTENTAGQYILYHHATTDRHCTMTCSQVSMDLTTVVTVHCRISFLLHHLMQIPSYLEYITGWTKLASEKFYTNEESSKNEDTSGVGDIRVLFPQREERKSKNSFIEEASHISKEEFLPLCWAAMTNEAVGG